MDITQLILDDHHEQRRLFSMLEQIDGHNVPALTAVWGRLAAFLDLHAETKSARSTQRCCGTAKELATRPMLRPRPTTRSVTIMIFAMPSPRLRSIRSARPSGARRSLLPTRPTASTWARRSAKA